MQGHVFSSISPEQRVRKDHPLRPIRAMVDKVLRELSPEFNKMYSKVGRPSIPPEQLLRALLLHLSAIYPDVKFVRLRFFFYRYFFSCNSGGMGLPGRSSSQTTERIHQRLPSK
jgi:hypothetical protein